MSKLVIVESPAKAKTIGKYLGSDYVVKASMGHLRDLPKKKMSIDIEHDFQPEYVPIEGKDKIIKEIRSEIRKSDFVYLATDPDREGEAISWHIKELFKLKDKNSRRVTFNEITKQAVRSGIENPRDIDIDLVNAQQARRILDRIVGYQLSPFLWRKVKRGLSAGRVQSVATRLVVDRENEIRAFVPEEYWSIEALLQTADGGKFSARYYGDANGKAELKNEEQAMYVVNAVTGKPFTVGNIKRGKKKRTAAPPFITSTLQQEASRKLNMTPRRTMSIAQELYEGIELGEYGLTGLITYMRTDSLRLADEATAAAAGFIRGRYGEEYYPGKPRVFKTKGNAQDAHEAIRPSNVQLLPEENPQVPDARSVQAVPPDLVALCGLPDGRRHSRYGFRRYRLRGSGVPCIRSYGRVPGLYCGFRGGHGRREKAGFRRKAAAPLRSGRQADRREDRAVPALYAAAGSLHRGIAHPRDGGTRHRPSVHLRADDFHHH